jgi:hypothetical protein
LDFFEENKQKIQTLQTQTDKKVDTMVHELCGLTKDEIKVMENS